MTSAEATERVVMRYFRSWQEGDAAALRECLADDLHLDWGGTVYTDPEVFVAAADAGISWADVELLASLFLPGTAVLVYEATNVDDDVRIRTAEYLTLEAERITTAIVAYTEVGAS
jgi:ketosteroid isomerase-like protein